MALALNNLKRVDMPLNKETKLSISLYPYLYFFFLPMLISIYLSISVNSYLSINWSLYLILLITISLSILVYSYLSIYLSIYLPISFCSSLSIYLSPSQRWLESDDTEGVLYITNSSRAGVQPSYCFGSFSGDALGWSYLSEEMQSVYSTA